MDWELVPVRGVGVFEESVGLVECVWRGDSRGALLHFTRIMGMRTHFIDEPDWDEKTAAMLDFATPPVDRFFVTTTLEQEKQTELHLQHALNRARGKPWGVIGRVRKPRNGAQRISHQLGYMRFIGRNRR
jgi:hypothetical protein